MYQLRVRVCDYHQKLSGGLNGLEGCDVFV